MAFTVFYLLSSGRVQNRVLQFGLLVVAGPGAFVYYSGGVYDLLLPYATRGSVEITMNLTGRLPLWDVIVSKIGENPWPGVGFAAFWNQDNYALIEHLVGFPVVSAHNGFLDMMSSTGAVGLAILVASCLCALLTVRRKALSGDLLGWLAFLLLFYVLQNLMVVLATLGLMASRPTRKVTAPGRRPRGRGRPPSLRGVGSSREGSTAQRHTARGRRRAPPGYDLTETSLRTTVASTKTDPRERG